LKGHNTQNSRYWGIGNPHLIHRVPFHGAKVGVWYTLSVRRIVGPVLYAKQLSNSERDVRQILQPVFRQLTDEAKLYGYFQHNSATLHKPNISHIS
jgi:hypothetical protein